MNENDTFANLMNRFARNKGATNERPNESVEMAGDIYINHQFKLAFRKPAGWQYQNIHDLIRLRAGYRFATSDTAGLAEISSSPVPLVVIASDSIMSTLCSSITVTVEDSPLDADETLASVMPELVRATGSLVSEFKMLQEPVLHKYSHYESAEFTFRFRYQDRSCHDGPVRNRTLTLLRHPYIYTFHMFDIPADNIDAQTEFDLFRDSIVLD